MPLSHLRDDTRVVAYRVSMSHFCQRRERWLDPVDLAFFALPLTETLMDQIESIASAINGYFDLMYDADDNRFPEVFHGACLVHGMRDGKLTAWSASEFRDVIRGRPSPAAMKSPREQEILTIEHTAPDLATAKVRVRIGQTGFHRSSYLPSHRREMARHVEGVPRRAGLPAGILATAGPRSG
jgi:Putative lumazine-binding